MANKMSKPADPFECHQFVMRQLYNRKRTVRMYRYTEEAGYQSGQIATFIRRYVAGVWC